MKKDFNSSHKFLEYLVNIYGEITFDFSATPYGQVMSWGTALKESHSLEKLEEILYQFDADFHIEYDLEPGSSRQYVLKLENDDLIGNIYYCYDHEYYPYPILGEMALIDLINEKIYKTLSEILFVTEEEFLENYNYEISFTTEKDDKEDVFSLSEFENENEVEISSSVWAALKESITKLSYEHGVNTNECDCEFSYFFENALCSVCEHWSVDVVFDKLKNDQMVFKAYDDLPRPHSSSLL